MSIIGARTGNPETKRDLTLFGPVAPTNDISVLVPPTSNVMIPSFWVSPNILPMPATPAAGPDKEVLIGIEQASSTLISPAFEVTVYVRAGISISVKNLDRFIKYLLECGPTKAFNAVVENLSYSRNSGATSQDDETYAFGITALRKSETHFSLDGLR